MRVFLAFVAALALAFVAGGFLQPATVTVERSVVVNRPAATVFTLLNGFRTWTHWSPWADLDPDADFERTGPEFGVGARLEWSGDPALLGSGWQEITVSEPWRRVELRTDIGPQGAAVTTYRVAGDRLGSRVTWAFETDVSAGQGVAGAWLGRYFGLFLARWVGADFERGLARLKAYAETLPERDFSDAEIERVSPGPRRVAQVRGTSAPEPEQVAAALAEAYGEISAWAAETGASLADPPLAVTRRSGDGAYRFEAAIPLETGSEAPPARGRVELGRSPGGPAARIVHRGPYGNTLASYEQLYAWIAARGLEPTGVSWEEYVSDPGETPPESLITHLYVLLEEDPAP